MKTILFSFQLFIPLLMISVGFLFSQHVPKTINPVWGYRMTRGNLPITSSGVFTENGVSIYSYSPF